MDQKQITTSIFSKISNQDYPKIEVKNASRYCIDTVMLPTRPRALPREVFMKK